jgi:hypothetical protein
MGIFVIRETWTFFGSLGEDIDTIGSFGGRGRLFLNIFILFLYNHLLFLIIF